MGQSRCHGHNGASKHVIVAEAQARQRKAEAEQTRTDLAVETPKPMEIKGKPVKPA